MILFATTELNLVGLVEINNKHAGNEYVTGTTGVH